MSLFHKKSAGKPAYDPARQQIAVRKSICTGEMTVGFVDRQTGKFTDVMMVRDQRELEAFCKSVGANPADVRTIY